MGGTEQNCGLGRGFVVNMLSDHRNRLISRSNQNNIFLIILMG
jgi:hypothetical protein